MTFQGKTLLNATLPAAITLQWPIVTEPKTMLWAPMYTPDIIVGWRTVMALTLSPVEPKVTPCISVTFRCKVTCWPIITQFAWSMQQKGPILAPKPISMLYNVESKRKMKRALKRGSSALNLNQIKALTPCLRQTLQSVKHDGSFA